MKKPEISSTACFAPNSVICGDVELKADSNIWFNSVLRAENAKIEIGERTNIQDGCIVHVDEGFNVIVGDDVTVGHGCILHGCEIGDGSLIGMGSIILNGAKIGKNCLIGAGSLVTQGMVIPDGYMAFGNPAKVKRELSEEQIQSNLKSAEHYVKESKEYDKENWFLK